MLSAIKAAGKQVRVAPKLKPIKQRVTINVTLSATPLLVSLTQGDNSFKVLKVFNGRKSLNPYPFTHPLTFNLTQNGICVKISAIRQILSNFAKRTKIFFVILHDWTLL